MLSKDLPPYTLTIHGNKEILDVSETLYGLFYEDINNDIISKVKNKRGLELMVCTDLSIDDSYIYYMNNGKLKTLIN